MATIEEKQAAARKPLQPGQAVTGGLGMANPNYGNEGRNAIAPVATPAVAQPAAQPQPSTYGQQMANVAGLFANAPANALKAVVGAPGYDRSKMVGDAANTALTYFDKPAAATIAKPAAAEVTPAMATPGTPAAEAQTQGDSNAIAVSEAQRRAGAVRAGNLSNPNSNAALQMSNPAGQVTKTVGPDGRVSYSGSNVSGDVSMVNQQGQALPGQPGGGFVRGTGDGTFRGGAPTGVSVGGQQYSSLENATMAANIRDGVDPRRGLDGGPQLSIMRNSGTSGGGRANKFDDGSGMTTPMTGRGMREQQRLNIDAANAQARLGMDQQRLGLDQQRAGNELATGAQTRESKAMEIAAAKQLQTLQAQYMAATGADKAKLAQTMRDLQGKEGRSAKDDFMVVGGGQEYDKASGLMRNVPQRLYNTKEGKFVDMQQEQTVDAAPAANHVNALRLDPALAAKFDEKYGAGAAKKILGAN